MCFYRFIANRLPRAHISRCAGTTIRAIAVALLILPVLAEHSSALGSCDSLCQLFGRMYVNEWTALVAPASCGLSNFSCNTLGLADDSWCRDYDGAPTLGGTVCSHFSSPSTSVFTGAKTGTTSVTGAIRYTSSDPLVNDWSYSAAGIRKSDGMILESGGGHAVLGDGSVYGFDVERAAASILAGGKGGNWQIIVPGPRFLPNSAARPRWSHQPNCGGWWWTTNYLNQKMMGAPHAYWGISAVQSLLPPFTATGKWVIGGMFYSCPPSGANMNPNEFLVVDSNSKEPTIVPTRSNIFPGAYNDLDGKYYVQNSENTIYFTATNIVTGAVARASNICVSAAYPYYGRQLIFPDPASPKSERAWFAVGYGQTILIRHIGGAVTSLCQKATPAIPGRMHGYVGYAYDDDDRSGRTFYWWGGTADIAKMTMNYADPIRSTAIAMTGTGTAPSCTTGAGGPFQAVEYIPASRPNSGQRAGIVAVGCGGVWIMRLL